MESGMMEDRRQLWFISCIVNLNKTVKEMQCKSNWMNYSWHQIKNFFFTFYLLDKMWGYTVYSIQLEMVCLAYSRAYVLFTYVLIKAVCSDQHQVVSVTQGHRVWLQKQVLQQIANCCVKQRNTKSAKTLFLWHIYKMTPTNAMYPMQCTN